MHHLLPKTPAWFRTSDRCPFSGLRVTHAELIAGTDPDVPYCLEIGKLGDRILLLKASGFVTASQMEKTLQYSDDYIEKHFDKNAGIVVVEDYGSVKGADFEARKRYFDYYKNRKFFMGAVLYNLLPFIKLSFNLARRLHFYNENAHAVDSYSEAIPIAIDILEKTVRPRTKEGFAGPIKDAGDAFRRKLPVVSRMAHAVMNTIGTIFLKSHSEALLKFIESINWEKDGFPPISGILTENISFRRVPEAIARIKSEVDSLIRERLKVEKTFLEYQSRLKALTIQMSMMEEKQRRVIASEVHDTISQELFVAQLQLEAFQKKLADPKQLEEISKIKAQIIKLIKDTRSLINEISPPVLYDFGFREALETLARSIQTKHALRVTTSFDGETDHIGDEVKIILYRNAKEIFHNIVKHAQARTAQAWVRVGDGRIEIRIQDDGVGFDVASMGEEGYAHEGFGLFDLREKMHHLGGTLDIRSNPGEGTEIVMRVPMTFN